MVKGYAVLSGYFRSCRSYKIDFLRFFAFDLIKQENHNRLMTPSYNKLKFLMMVIFPSFNFLAWTILLPMYEYGIRSARLYAIYDLSLSWFILVFQWSMNPRLSIQIHGFLCALLLFIGLGLFQDSTGYSIFWIIFDKGLSEYLLLPGLIHFMYLQLWFRTCMVLSLIFFYKDTFLRYITSPQDNQDLGRVFNEGQVYKKFKLWVLEQRLCSICCDEFDDEVSVLTCGHAYHPDCINLWSEHSVHNNCPSCRIPISPV